jgi:hypothetical protein
LGDGKVITDPRPGIVALVRTAGNPLGGWKQAIVYVGRQHTVGQNGRESSWGIGNCCPGPHPGFCGSVRTAWNPLGGWKRLLVTRTVRPELSQNSREYPWGMETHPGTQSRLAR